MATAVSQGATSNAYINGVLSGVKWGGNFTFSFPTSGAQYPGYPSSEPFSSFAAVSTQQREATRAILYGDTIAATNVVQATSLSSFILTGVGEAGGFGNGANGLGDIRLGQSPLANPTAYAYYPSNAAGGQGGDVWFGTFYAGTSNDYRVPVAGNYAYLTHIHELGHALGLKHAHEAGGPANAPVPANRDAIEFTVMSYRTYPGGSTSGGYTFGQFDAPQTFMMIDILALQTQYGADYGAAANNGSTIYRWNPATGEMSINGVNKGTPGANKVFLTVWDGGGTDVYDMSNYTTAVTINLAPGLWSTTSSAQRGNLGNGHFAAGNVYNSFLYNNDLRSIIENAAGGSANDVISGNVVNNALNGNAGNDVIKGLEGNDSLNGGTGSDNLQGGVGNDSYYYDGTDTMVELANQGIDLVVSPVTHILAANFERLLLSGALNINGGGNAVDNVVVGNTGNNTVVGFAGNDSLSGGNGNDILIGGAGKDTLTGGAGFDYFDFNLVTESLPGATRDLITDFVRAQGDRVDLSGIDANVSAGGNQAFVFTAAATFTAAGQVRYAGGVIYVNVDADATAEMEIQIGGVSSMTGADFIL